MRDPHPSGPRPDQEKPPALSRRSLLLAASSIGLGCAAGSIAKPRPAPVKPGGKGRLSIGLSGPTYYSGFCPFLNWWKQAAPMQIHLADGRTLGGKEIWNAGIYLDASTGELRSPALAEVTSLSRIFFASFNSFQQTIGCDYSGEEFAVEWDGSAEVRVDFLTAGAAQQIVGPNHMVFKMGLNPGNTSINLTITDSNNPPRNIRIYQTRYRQQVLNGETFNPDWLRIIGPFGIIRCMDWCAVNNSTIVDFEQLADLNYCSWGARFQSSTAVDTCGTKGGVHPAILCELGNRTGAEIHVCIPHLATDEFVTAFASHFRDHAHGVVIYELSNECWNAIFNQFGDCLELGKALWPGDPLRSYKYYGYRAAACMNIIRHVYGGDVRWRGALATQTVNIAVTEAILSGVEHWRASNAGRQAAPGIRDLFKSLNVTGYFGDVIRCTQPESITRADPGVVKSPRHGYQTGQLVRCFFGSGMTELDSRDVTVRKLDEDSYSIDVDTSGFGVFIGDPRNYIVPAELFKLMEESRKRNADRPAAYPTRYTYFNRQLSQSLLEGQSEAGFATAVSVASLRTTFWPAQLSLARANGLALQQYEGGCHFVGDAHLAGYGGNSEFLEYLLQHGHSPEAAAVYSAMYESFERLGGHYPSKFVADGVVSQFGSWAGVRYWPTEANRDSMDTGNPVWRATVAANRPIESGP